MRTSVPTPTADPLPYFRHDGPSGSPGAHADLSLRSDAIARFDALLHEIHPDAPRIDPTRLQHLTDWLLALPPARAHDVLDRRLRRIEELRAMLDDFDWDPAPALRARLLKLLAYIDRDDDLIDDHRPLLGLLDDVLLIELAWPAFSAEADEYRDFCAWRDAERPGTAGDLQRAAWVRDRLAEIALLRHQFRINGSHYGPSLDPQLRFRVG